jgi:HEPN domain-containing protein
MQNEEINVNKIFSHWIVRSDQDFETMMHLFDSKDYHWSLFMGHLVIERLLKAVVVKNTKSYAPFTHDLRRLAKLSEIEFDEEQKRLLDTITTFNLNTRYDDYISDFHKRCTLEFSNKWIVVIKDFREWIKTKL